jgi:hypothetical protein
MVEEGTTMKWEQWVREGRSRTRRKTRRMLKRMRKRSRGVHERRHL